MSRTEIPTTKARLVEGMVASAEAAKSGTTSPLTPFVEGTASDVCAPRMGEGSRGGLTTRCN